MQLWFSRQSDTSIREQLATQIVLAIVSGELAPGQRLPSTRELARRFRLHPNTVSARYRQLVKGGWLAVQKGSGRIQRDRIHEIRVERREGSNMLAGALRGGAAGAGLGAIAARGALGGPAFALALLGASTGARAGRDIHSLHGKVVYRRP